jgi:hypothetical protein
VVRNFSGAHLRTRHLGVEMLRDNGAIELPTVFASRENVA